jgi:hypothetical protein
MTCDESERQPETLSLHHPSIAQLCRIIPMP